MKTLRLGRIGVVVYDIEQAKRNYTYMYDITSWDTQEYAPAQAMSYGREVTGARWISACGSTGAFTFELVQPLAGESPFHEHLRTKREGIAFLQVVVDGDPQAHFRSLGIPVAYTAGERVFYDTRKSLGGFLVEAVPHDVFADALMPAEPPTDPALPTDRIFHFGVLVHDVLEALPAYRDVFGITKFDCKTWETGWGRLDAPQYRGEPVDHGYFTAQGMVGDFGFEIIQSNHGSSHYNREFFDVRGPGIHHIFPWLAPDDVAWDSVVSRMGELGYPLCMGSTLRGQAAEFGYFDTFDALGGYLVEIVVRRRTPEPEFAQPDWVVDYQ
ncbi:hypothetical protein [Corynebacterium sp.]|uniref:hypothetical protein n=1 Tax=Corynebacterium sp. TaxID=1720 RepID=UPI0026DD87F5|nr:hypothetical protein [Corynebacterium sp.]MDO5076954.1 hypothetical protein [Corynebacterium sp.]